MTHKIYRRGIAPPTSVCLLLLCSLFTGCAEEDKIPGFTGGISEEPFRVIVVPDTSERARVVEADAGDADGVSSRTDATFIEVNDLERDLDAPQAPLTITTWNLRNFSTSGKWDDRLTNIASVLDEIDSDVVLVQELLRAIGPQGSVGEAIESLVEILERYDWAKGAWQSNDSSVGVLYRSDRFSKIEVRELFSTRSNYAFPRPPLLLRVADKLSGNRILSFINLHLKSYEEDGSDIDRRKEACIMLDAFIQAQKNKVILVGGDLNDSPRDAPGKNVFTDTFLNEELYSFATLALPEDAFTFGGVINGAFTGLFLDHFVVTRELEALFDSVTTSVYPISLDEMKSWIDDHSDHLPVTIRLQ